MGLSVNESMQKKSLEYTSNINQNKCCEFFVNALSVSKCAMCNMYYWVALYSLLIKIQTKSDTQINL
jgi:hypothetical protein